MNTDYYPDTALDYETANRKPQRNSHIDSKGKNTNSPIIFFPGSISRDEDAFFAPSVVMFCH